jgi:hypothetical protein
MMLEALNAHLGLIERFFEQNVAASKISIELPMTMTCHSKC